MDYMTWSEKNLEQVFLAGNDKKTSIWLSKPNNKPLIVLVHGISGDHAGLIPVAHELTKRYQVVLVDLPGHGMSDEISLPDAQTLKRWFVRTLSLIEEQIGPVPLICAHSFGCSAVLDKKILRSKKVVLINPVPTPSPMYAHYSRMIMDSARFWAHIYNWRVFILLRGVTLAKVRTRESLRRVRWVGWNSRPTYRQIIFQSGLVDMILDGTAYKGLKDGLVTTIICGMFDTTACERDSLDMREVFGPSKTIFLRGGHLLPIESPTRVADLVDEAMLH